MKEGSKKSVRREKKGGVKVLESTKLQPLLTEGLDSIWGRGEKMKRKHKVGRGGSRSFLTARIRGSFERA